MSKRAIAIENNQADVDMTPMLDIVFIMLIFFIVSTSFLQTMGFDVLRPQSKAPSANPAPVIVVQVREDGEISINGRMVDIERIPANIETILTQQNSTQILIDADFNAKHQRVVSVMNQIKTIEELAISVVSKSNVH